MDQEIKTRLHQIADAHGGLLEVDDVIDDARNPKSPLHDRFTWNVAEAAVQWWRQEARQLIRMFEIEIEHPPARAFKVQEWVHLEKDDGHRGGGYRQSREVMAVDAMREQLLAQAERDWKSWKARYGHLAQFAKLVAAGDETFSATGN